MVAARIEVQESGKALRNKALQNHIGQATMIVGALMHEGFINLPTEKSIPPDEMLGDAVAIVANILKRMECQQGDHPPLPFDW